MKKLTVFLITVILFIFSFSFASEAADSRIKNIQQYLNESLTEYKLSYIPCDGVTTPYMTKALVYALQKLEGLPYGTANGNFGVTTKKCCPEIPYDKGDGSALSYSEMQYTDEQIKDFVLLLEYALYVNGFDAGEADGIYDTETENALKAFQSLMCMNVTGKADLATWLSLLTAPGDTSRNAAAADTATILDSSKAAFLYSQGYRYIGRYLTNASSGINKAVTRQEAEIILSSGMNFFPIYQTSGNSASYFSADKGTQDAGKAIEAAFSLGLPEGTVIYFAVDFDATISQINSNILPYFRSISERMKNVTYKVGVYGARGVCSTVSSNGYADYSFVSSLSSGFYANAGFKMPDNW
ncbi:MAG: DUF1906 domain-containing protein, partial [Clostridia bacterium]|nr:DUF1906 domain-containing protein [Clostridia bacterium]